ncbi:MAG: FHA domain-containing protein, partial [Planctomycetes bacterium]|nr:FHA domain-containing protein [Planctomycetota bacterium]
MHQLRITAGPGAGRVLALNPAYTYTLGRDPAAHLSVPEDQTLSRTHAEFVPQGGGWILRNKSQHGSLVNGQVMHGDAPIPVNGTFQIGAITVALEAQGAAGAAVPPAQPAFGGDPNAPTVPPPMPGQQPGQPAAAQAG